MEKLDLHKKYKSYYTAKTTPEIIDIAQAQYLSIPGKGDPSQKAFSDNIQALYTTAYALKFRYKSLNKDFVVPKLEALWWFDEKAYKDISMENAPEKIPRSEWEYRLLIRMPEFVNNVDVENEIKNVLLKKDVQLVKNIELFQMNEGTTVQILHVGPFETEVESLKKMSILMDKENFSKNGFHHEIYLSDFRKTQPEKLKTILREPVTRNS